MIGHGIRFAIDDLKIRRGLSVAAGRDDPSGQLVEFLGLEAAEMRTVLIDIGQLIGGDEAHAGNTANMIDILREARERRFGLFRGKLRRGLPLLARRVPPVREIHAVPKLLVHPFARMIENADQPAAVIVSEARGDGRDLGLGVLDDGGIVQLHARVHVVAPGDRH